MQALLQMQNNRRCFFCPRSLDSFNGQYGYKNGTDGWADGMAAIQRADERLHGLQSNQDVDARAHGGDWMGG